MFGDNERTHELVEFLLELYSLEELLEMNDLSPEEVLAHLLEAGLLIEPRSVVEAYEEDDET
jgi:hypothetical protein